MFPIRRPLRPTLPLAAVALTLVCASPGTAGIITVTATAGPGLPSLLTDKGAALPTGNEVQLGFFNSGFDFEATSDLSTLQANWNQFGDPALGNSLGVQNIFGEDGRFSGDLVGNDSGFASKQIHIFAFYTNGNKVPDAAWKNVKDYGIFTNQAWKFPAGDSGTPFTMVSTADVTISSGGLQLTAVPEPSTAGVCGVILGASILFARRRSPGTPSSHRSLSRAS